MVSGEHDIITVGGGLGSSALAKPWLMKASLDGGRDATLG